MIRSPTLTILAGALAIVVLALLGAQVTGPRLAARLPDEAQAAIAEAGGAPVKADFGASAWATRHPLLRGGERLDEATRARVARAVGGVPGVGAVRWADGSRQVTGTGETPSPLHCQQDVDALLRARTIRFEEASTRVDAASGELIDEVAAALRPCLGSVIAITGHTDSSGSEAGNRTLSHDRAESVRRALVRRGIPSDGLRATGMGSAEPVEGLDPADPANRRIEFKVISTAPVRPTVVDTPGAR